MLPELHYHNLFPKIAEVGKPTEVSFRLFGNPAKNPSRPDTAEDISGYAGTYTVEVIPSEQDFALVPYGSYEVTPVNGVITFTHTFDKEQEYFICVYSPAEKEAASPKLHERGHIHKAGHRFHMYALDSDLYALRPYRGDLHVHSLRSDGQEYPSIVAANYRKGGMDFMALTDHGNYAPSVEMIDSYKGIPIDICLCNGEEVHPPNNHVHTVNFGGKQSVNEFIRENPELYIQQVMEIEAGIEPEEGLDTYEYASLKWVYNKIREYDGLAIFVHPHWIETGYHMPDVMLRRIYADLDFDAYELLGGQTTEENVLQKASHYEYAKDASTIPVVSSSDSHGTERDYLFTWYTTIVFAPDCTENDIIASVKANRSVAIEQYPSEDARLYGPYRYVKLAAFLLKYYFPLHDELCFEEGRLMKEAVLGSESSIKMLELMQGRTKSFLNKVWGLK